MCLAFCVLRSAFCPPACPSYYATLLQIVSPYKHLLSEALAWIAYLAMLRSSLPRLRMLSSLMLDFGRASLCNA